MDVNHFFFFNPLPTGKPSLGVFFKHLLVLVGLSIELLCPVGELEFQAYEL